MPGPGASLQAIVTGGSSGIGKATAALLAARGVRLSLIARNQERLAQVQHELTAQRTYPDQSVNTFAADVADRATLEQAIAAALAQSGPPDLLVTAVGLSLPGRFAKQPLEAVERLLAVNYWGTLYTIRAALPAMLARRRGHIVLVSSGAGLIGVYGYSAYSASKFAVRGLAEVLRAELKPQGVRVSIVYPPDTNTPMPAQEEQAKPAATRAIARGGDLVSAEYVARALVRGVERGAFCIGPGAQMGLLARLHSLLAPLLHWLAV